MKRHIQTGIKVLVSCLLLLILAKSLPLAQVFDTLARVSLSAWLVNTALIGLATALGAYRWHLAARRQIPLRICLSYYWLGIFYSYVLPGSLAGDVARTAALATQLPSHRTALLPVSVFLDRLGGLTTTLLVLLLAWAAMSWPHQNQSLVMAVVLTGAASLITFPLLAHRLFSRLVRISWLPSLLKKIGGSLLPALGEISLRLWLRIIALSIVIHAITCCSYAWSAQATGVDGELWRIALYYAVFNLAVLLPITIAGFGLREQSAVWLLGKEGAAGIASVALSWFVLATTLVHVLIGALLHLRLMFKPRPSPATLHDDV